MKEYKIKLAISELERDLVFSQVKGIFLKTYNTIPAKPNLEQHILYAEINNKILGSVGLLFSDEVIEMPFNKLFSIGNKYKEILENKHSYITGWVSEENNVGLFLSYCSGLYSIKNNCDYAISILKPNIAQYLNKISNNSWIKFEGLSIDINKVRNEDSNYFLSEPTPELYFCKVKECVNSLESNSLIKKMNMTTKIKF